MKWLVGEPVRYRYNRLKNVRVDLSTMVVERKYVSPARKIIWEVVDYKTTHKLACPRVCPHDYLARLLRDAF